MRAEAGETTKAEEAFRCREEVVSEERYTLDTPESTRRGEGLRAESSVTICSLCDIPVQIFAGTSFGAVDVDLLLRGMKGEVRFSANMLPLISAVEEECRKRKKE